MIYEHEVVWNSRPKPDANEYWGMLFTEIEAGMMQMPRTSNPVTFPQQRDQMIPKAKAYLENRGLDWNLAYSSNWYPALYRGPRIIIPCSRTDGGKFWQGRLIEEMVDPNAQKHLKRWDSPDGGKGDAVVALGPYGGNRSAMFIVEGPMDALAVAGAGFASVALLGCKPGISVVEHVSNLAEHFKVVFGVPDRDSIPEWAKIQRLFAAVGIHLRLVEPWSPHKDIAAMPKQERHDFLNVTVETA
jgi:hypothetical protein